MKLEHYLAPYLPYALKMYGNKEVQTLEGLGDGIVKMKDFGLFTPIHGVKPILRPLSDLTKEIEHNGEKFVPFKKLGWRYMEEELGSLIYCEYGESPKAVVNVIDYLDDYFSLLSWHFDVFWLIEKGEAIDINTLEL
jgi:hypothetical protein